MFARIVVGVLMIGCGLAVGLGNSPCALAQPAPKPTPEVVPTPAPVPDPDAQAAPETYGPLEAGRDAQAMAERQRRAAVDRQLQTQRDIRWYHTGPRSLGRYYVHRYALPYIRAYAPPLAAYEAERAIEAALAPAPVYGSWPVPGDYYGYGVPYVGEPFVDRVEQPLGHEKVWTGPNSYVYQPRHEPPTRAQREPEPVPPPAAVELPAEQPPAVPPPLNSPEDEPRLQPLSGPREF